jgi:uncharacterized membrane protein YhaH (DUF805 family)
MDVLRYLSSFLNFRGRLRRLDFAFFFAVFIAGMMAAVMLARVSSGIPNPFSALLGIVVFAIVVALVIGFFATGVRRLHDRDYSGWMIVIFYVIPLIIGSEVGDGKTRIGFRFHIGFEEGWLIPTISTFILIWAIVELFVLRGIIGPNRYGPDPLGPNALPPEQATP